MQPRSYQDLLEEKLQTLSDARRDLHAWQCRLELKRLYPGLFQAVFGRDNREKFMGAVDYHIAEGYTVEEAYELVARLAPELAEELATERLEEV